MFSLAGIVASIWQYGPVFSEAVLISAISAMAAIILILMARRRVPPRYIVIDGSNVMHWKNYQPLIETVRHVLMLLEQRNYVPIVWFDANVGYKIGARYLGPLPLSKILKIPPQQIFVAPKGSPADPFVLDCAKELNAKVVTNDQFRDWTESHPHMKEPGFLVTGGIQDNKIVL
ncbi:MAG: hypothetical protein JKY94_14905, partial [Rhodobacteraceae bacterium]|nr:hypothetical protein [Paracoccaceae bacterium]